MFKQDVLLAIHNFSDQKCLANNAKIRSSLKCLIIRYILKVKQLSQFDEQTLSYRSVKTGFPRPNFFLLPNSY